MSNIIGRVSTCQEKMEQAQRVQAEASVRADKLERELVKAEWEVLQMQAQKVIEVFYGA